jgi:HrpA-like RNA helicase
MSVGKSTLLPALLIAEGYDKVLVTQPRRFPCTSVSNRVNDTIKTDINGASEQLAGWAISGEESNQNASVLYVTDGLLRESLLNNENFISVHTEVKKATVFFIDEVHERSINIDLCLALLARLLTLQPIIRTKLKLIISSATLDSSVPQLFQRIPGIHLSQFQLPQIGLLHHVRKIARPKENILDVVQELFKKRQRHDQILCFVNSVTEVHQCCRVLEQLTQGTIKGYPLIQSQSAAEQRSYIEHGSVFFSTTVAETSLTFPSLKYVVDTGMINIPVYKPDKRRTVMTKIRAAESTIKQRLGRLGRTQDGEYYALYDFRVEDQCFPIPQICQLDLSNLEFILRRSPIRHGLHHMQEFLPDKPEPAALDATVQELFQLSS